MIRLACTTELRLLAMELVKLKVSLYWSWELVFVRCTDYCTHGVKKTNKQTKRGRSLTMCAWTIVSLGDVHVWLT